MSEIDDIIIPERDCIDIIPMEFCVSGNNVWEWEKAINARILGAYDSGYLLEDAFPLMIGRGKQAMCLRFRRGEEK